MKANKEQPFDLEAVYDSQINPLMEKIIAICKEHKLPMFATFLYANNPAEDDAALCTTNLMFEDRPIPDELLKLAPLVTGGSRVPPMRMRVTKADGSVIDTVVIG